MAGAFRKAQQEGRTVLFVDESAFYLLPGMVRTYAPRGQTPLLRVPLSRDHLSAISGISPDGRLFLHVQADTIRGSTVVQFLRQVLRLVPGPLLVIWDGGPIHRAQPVKDFLRTPIGRRVHVEQLPAYAPELNPDEGIWQHLKHVELRNVRCPTLWDLQQEVRLAVRRLRRRHHLIRACFTHAGCL